MDKPEEEKEKRGEKRDLAAHTDEPELSPTKKTRLDAPAPGTDAHLRGAPTSGALQGDAMDIDEPPLCTPLCLLSSNFLFANTLSKLQSTLRFAESTWPSNSSTLK